jgi:hypothetical protein
MIKIATARQPVARKSVCDMRVSRNKAPDIALRIRATDIPRRATDIAATTAIAPEQIVAFPRTSTPSRPRCLRFAIHPANHPITNPWQTVTGPEEVMLRSNGPQNREHDRKSDEHQSDVAGLWFDDRN